MAITWAPIEAALEAQVANDSASAVTAACADLKTALDSFISVFTNDADLAYEQISAYFTALAAATTAAECWLTADQIKTAIPAEMTTNVTTAFELLAVSDDAQTKASRPGAA
jgi:F420-0:gamma-glutamyl ligase-like protein